MPTIDQRGRFWRARVRIPGFKQKTRSFDTEAEARVWASRMEAELRDGKDVTSDRRFELTLDEALERYLREITPTKKGQAQEERRIGAWRRRTELGQLKLSKLNASHFNEFKKERQGEGVASNTIRLDLALISNLFSVARKEWNLTHLQNPIADIRMPKPGKPRNRRLSVEERLRLSNALKKCRNPLVPVVVQFALETAARQGEILELLKSDVDLHKRIAIFRETKNGTDRAVPLSRGAADILKELIALPGKKVFPITRDGLVGSWRRALGRANINNFRFHDLRHEGTTSLFERGLKVMEVQQITGHKTLKILLNYTHMNPAHIVDRLDDTEPRKPSVTDRRPSDDPDIRCEVRPGPPDDYTCAHTALTIREKIGAATNLKQPLGSATAHKDRLGSNVIAFPRRR